MSVLRINHNIASLNTQRNLEVSSFGLGKSLQKLSSGFRINTAADGPADLIISEGLRGQIAGIQAALRNTQEGANYLSIADGAMNEISSLLVGMRGLAVHAANGITSTSQRLADNNEAQAAIESIDRINLATRYGGDAIFSVGTVTLHIGEGNGGVGVDEVSVTIDPVGKAALGADAIDISTIDLTTMTLSDPTGAKAAIGILDLAIDSLAKSRGALGAVIKDTLQANANSLSVAVENVTATESFIRDTNMAQETSEYTKNQILVQAGVSVLAQANAASQSVLQLLR